jgi:hypothetical protein
VHTVNRRDPANIIAQHGNWALNSHLFHHYTKEDHPMDRFTIRDGEDVAPEFVKAEDLEYWEDNPKIDVAPQTAEHAIVATVTDVTITSGFVHVKAEEFAYPFIIPADTLVYFADEDES